MSKSIALPIWTGHLFGQASICPFRIFCIIVSLMNFRERGVVSSRYSDTFNSGETCHAKGVSKLHHCMSRQPY